MYSGGPDRAMEKWLASALASGGRGDLLLVECFCMFVSFLGVRLSHGIPKAVIKGIQGDTTHSSQVALPDVETLGTCVAVAKRTSMAHKC